MSYKGLVVELPLGLDGFTATKNLADTIPTQLLQAMNIEYADGTMRKEGGSVKYNSSAVSGTPIIISGWDWVPSSGTQRMVVYTDDGKLLKDSGDGSFPVTLKSGLATDKLGMFVEGGKEAAAQNRKLFFFNGNDTVQVLSGDGATTSDISSPPADWSGTNQPSFGLVHEGRLWAGGNANDPHRVYASTSADQEDFVTDGLSLSVFPGEGEKIVAGFSFKGFIVLWKFPRGVYVIDTTAVSFDDWKVKRLNQSTGGVSAMCAVIADDDIIFIDASGNFQFLSGVSEFGDMSARNLSKIAFLNIWMRENIDLSRLNKAQAIWYPKKREARFALTKSGSSVNDIQVVVDFNRREVPRFRFSDQNTCESLWLRLETPPGENTYRPICGDNAGFVWKLDDDTRSKDGSAYEGRLQTTYDDLGWFDKSLAPKRKSGQFLEVAVEPKGNWNIDVELYWDDTYEATYTFNMGGTGATLGSFVLDTDILSGTSVLNRRRRITGSGQRFSLIVKNSGVGQDFSIAKFLLYFNLSDEALRE